jgi:hypothetical protein
MQVVRRAILCSPQTGKAIQGAGCVTKRSKASFVPLVRFAIAQPARSAPPRGDSSNLEAKSEKCSNITMATLGATVRSINSRMNR